jgi:hypothetical protein
MGAKLFPTQGAVRGRTELKEPVQLAESEGVIVQLSSQARHVTFHHFENRGFAGQVGLDLPDKVILGGNVLKTGEGPEPFPCPAGCLFFHGVHTPFSLLSAT